VLLRLPYLALTSVFAFIRLLPISDTNKDIEILALRHQLSVLQRQIDNPRLTPPDRAFLAALLHRLPRLQLRQLHLIVSPDTVPRWHRDLLRRHHAKASRPKRPGRPPTRRRIQSLVLRLARENPSWATDASTANWPRWQSRLPPPRSGRSSTATGSSPHPNATARPGPPSCAAKHTRSSPPTSSKPGP
jgi:hypothetical protein